MQKKTQLPDTNAILRYLLKDHPDQFESSRAFFEGVRIGKEKAVVSECVLVECVYVLTKFYKVPRVEAVGALSQLLLYKGVRNKDKEILQQALKIFAEKNIAIVDCILLARSRLENRPLFSFDKELKKLERGTAGPAGT